MTLAPLDNHALANLCGPLDANLRQIDVDERFAMRADLLAEQVVRDRKAGFIPCFVSATVGTTSSNGIDPLPEIGLESVRYRFARLLDEIKPKGRKRRSRSRCPGLR